MYPLSKNIRLLLCVALIVLPVYLAATLYYLDKTYFLCPVQYVWDICVRCDKRGDGLFAAKRNGNRMHRGIDLLAEVGAPVFASRAGRVFVANQPKGMGRYVVISHSDNLTTLYGHLSSVLVNSGDFVRQGQLIGKVGKTGNADHPGIQPHLHFEIKKDGLLQDPLEYLE